MYHVKRFQIYKLKINRFKKEKNVLLFTFLLLLPTPRKEHTNKLSNTKCSALNTYTCTKHYTDLHNVILCFIMLYIVWIYVYIIYMHI